MSKHTILIAGGTGLIGNALQSMLTDKGYHVRLLTRTPKGPNQFFWNPAHCPASAFGSLPDDAINRQALEGVHAVVNLAGAGIADKRWTPARKRELLESRIRSTNLIVRAIEEMNHKPAVLVNASAIGYYGNSGERLMTENDLPVEEAFMVDLCEKWEKIAALAQVHGIRTAVIRIGVVLAREGGALPQLDQPLRWGVAPYFGDGQAWWSWIHLKDICKMFIWAIENQQVNGIYNGVAPHPVRNLELVREIIKAKKAKALALPVPAIAMRMALGQMSAVVLNSNRISAQKALEAGFQFEFDRIDAALNQLYG